MTASPKALRLKRIGLAVADLALACFFYEQGLGFERIVGESRDLAALTGIADARAEVAVLRLGLQQIELLQFTPPGRPYPPGRAASDPWFQHFAIVTADMAAACAATRGAGAQAISSNGPQLLPPETGSIVAYKFRDPEGHPLELSWFPPAVAAAAWRDPAPGEVFLGIDHSAIAVADVEASIAFYGGLLGMSVAARQINSGPTQAALDGLAGAEVEIVSLEFADGGPHLELLAYRHPRPVARTIDPSPNDIAATRLVLAVEGLAEIIVQLGAGRLVSKGVVAQPDGSGAALIRDPDGHVIELHER